MALYECGGIAFNPTSAAAGLFDCAGRNHPGFNNFPKAFFLYKWHAQAVRTPEFQQLLQYFLKLLD